MTDSSNTETPPLSIAETTQTAEQLFNRLVNSGGNAFCVASYQGGISIGYKAGVYRTLTEEQVLNLVGWLVVVQGLDPEKVIRAIDHAEMMQMTGEGRK